MSSPSISMWGSLSMTTRFTHAPGSPSSALHTRYFGSTVASFRNCHLVPVEKNEPECPRSVEPFTTSISSSRDIFVASTNCLYPPRPAYCSMLSGSMTPQLYISQRTCIFAQSSSHSIGTPSAAPWMTPTACSFATPCTAAFANASALSAVTWP